MKHFLLVFHDDTDSGERALRGALDRLAPFIKMELLVLTEPQRRVTKEALRSYGTKQDKNLRNLVRKRRSDVAGVSERIQNIDDAYDVIGWDEPIPDADESPGYPCPDDPDGLHHAGCGCDA